MQPAVNLLPMYGACEEVEACKGAYAYTWKRAIASPLYSRKWTAIARG